MVHMSFKSTWQFQRSYANKYCYRLSWWEVNCFRSWFSYELIQKLDICKGTSCHHSIVTSSSSVRVELSRCQSRIKRVFKRESVILKIIWFKMILWFFYSNYCNTSNFSVQDVKTIHSTNVVIVNHVIMEICRSLVGYSWGKLPF